MEQRRAKRAVTNKLNHTGKRYNQPYNQQINHHIRLASLAATLAANTRRTHSPHTLAANHQEGGWGNLGSPTGKLNFHYYKSI